MPFRRGRFDRGTGDGDAGRVGRTGAGIGDSIRCGSQKCHAQAGRSGTCPQPLALRRGHCVLRRDHGGPSQARTCLHARLYERRSNRGYRHCRTEKTDSRFSERRFHSEAETADLRPGGRDLEIAIFGLIRISPCRRSAMNRAGFN